MVRTMNNISRKDFTNWLPIRFYWSGNLPSVDWMLAKDLRFKAPFFEQTIGKGMEKPFNLLFRRQTSVDELLQWHEHSPGLEPSGFIFHLSRCGSTLITQMLAALEQHIVLSEPGPVDSVLSAHVRNPIATEEKRLLWFRAMVSALMQKKEGADNFGFVKFDSWHTAYLPLIQKAFPNVPKIFLYRDPIEILVSQLEQRGSQTIPGNYTANILGIDLGEAWQLSPEEYCSLVLAHTCNAILEHYADKNILLVNYTELPEFVWKKMKSFFGQQWTEEEILLMKTAALKDAKDPHFAFSSDSALKQERATLKMHEYSDRLVKPLYDQLETLRVRQ
jgi:hypothetical protein